jgi:hypothetical protein
MFSELVMTVVGSPTAAASVAMLALTVSRKKLKYLKNPSNPRPEQIDTSMSARRRLGDELTAMAWARTKSSAVLNSINRRNQGPATA